MLYTGTYAAGPPGRVQSTAVVATVQGAVGAGTLVGGVAYNPHATAAYLQVFDSAAGEVVLGTTVPVFTEALPAGQSVRLRPSRPIRCPNGISFAVTGGRLDATSPAGPVSVHLETGGRVIPVPPPADPLSALDDDFESGDTNVTNRGWSWYDEATVATQTMAGGELHLVSTVGGDGDAWWYNQQNGNLLYREVTGDFDARTRVRVRDAAGTGSPASNAVEWRFAGLAVHDPDRTSRLNYVHLMLGADPDGQNRVEWKTTDESVSTWGSDPGSAPLDYDLRIVRNGQVFTLYYRATNPAVALSSNAGWTLLETVDRTDSNIPPSVTASEPLPNTVQVGITGGYAGPQTTLDIQAWFEEIRFITP